MKIYLVDNGLAYSSYAVLGVFTDKQLADAFAKKADGNVEEWESDIPPERWMYAAATLRANKENGKWVLGNVISFPHGARLAEVFNPDATAELGWFSGWGERDPKTGEFTCGYATASGKTEEEAKKKCLDAFWKVVLERDTD
jgi:hypothetical protein